MKQVLEQKLFDAIHELKIRAATKSSTQAQIQRMFGVVLGIRIAIMECNRLNNVDPHLYSGRLFIEQLMRDEFGQKTKADIQAYAFPEA